MARAVQLLMYDVYCPIRNGPIKAEMRTVDSQSGLRTLLLL